MKAVKILIAVVLCAGTGAAVSYLTSAGSPEGYPEGVEARTLSISDLKPASVELKASRPTKKDRIDQDSIAADAGSQCGQYADYSWSFRFNIESPRLPKNLRKWAQKGTLRRTLIGLSEGQSRLFLIRESIQGKGNATKEYFVEENPPGIINRVRLFRESDPPSGGNPYNYRPLFGLQYQATSVKKEAKRKTESFLITERYRTEPGKQIANSVKFTPVKRNTVMEGTLHHEREILLDKNDSYALFPKSFKARGKSTANKADKLIKGGWTEEVIKRQGQVNPAIKSLDRSSPIQTVKYYFYGKKTDYEGLPGKCFLTAAEVNKVLFPTNLIKLDPETETDIEEKKQADLAEDARQRKHTVADLPGLNKLHLKVLQQFQKVYPEPEFNGYEEFEDRKKFLSCYGTETGEDAFKAQDVSFGPEVVLIFFGFRDASLTDNDRKTIKAIAKSAGEHVWIQIFGNSSVLEGTEKFRGDLAARRADAVYQEFIKNGIPASKVERSASVKELKSPSAAKSCAEQEATKRLVNISIIASPNEK